jgi:hypothetical protein
MKTMKKEKKDTKTLIEEKMEQFISTGNLIKGFPIDLKFPLIPPTIHQDWEDESVHIQQKK